MRKFTVRVNGKVFQVEVEEMVGGAPVEAMPLPVVPPPPTPPSPTAGRLIAPMPGTILAIKVAAGEQVVQGQVLLILEAMKMENEIPAPIAGRIASIAVEKGAAVSSGDLLLTIE